MWVRAILGAILLIAGVLDLLKFGMAILLRSPQLLIGILLVMGGSALLSAGNRSNLLK